MSTRASDTRPPRDRLLDAASELFYQHGVHTVGIDTIIERAGVAKASLYSTFGSKEELVRAYLEARHASRRAAVLAEMELHDDPRGKLLAVFDVLDTTVKQPEFRGCAFANASAESEPDSAATEVTRKVRGWLLGVMAEQATALGAADPAGLARQLTLLYDGALAQSRLERGPAAATAAKAAAQVLIDGAFPAARKPQSRPTRAARSTRSQPPGRLSAGHMRFSVVGCADPFPGLQEAGRSRAMPPDPGHPRMGDDMPPGRRARLPTVNLQMARRSFGTVTGV